MNKTTFLPPYKIINKLLSKKYQGKSPIVILGRIHQKKKIYRICQVYPTIDILHDFNISTLLRKRQYRGVLKVIRGGKKKISFFYNPNEKHYPFEELNL